MRSAVVLFAPFMNVLVAKAAVVQNESVREKFKVLALRYNLLQKILFEHPLAR